MTTKVLCHDPNLGTTSNNMEEFVEDQGLPTMNKRELAKVALEHGGYSTPSLNDTLYLHFKGYRKIENLEEYTGLKSLWLHSNGFAKIANLGHLSELRCLFLQSNALTKIENLQGLSSLVQLDLSENNLKFVEGLSHLTQLTTLNLSKNALKDAESIAHLEECIALSSLDLSKNDLSGSDIVECLAGISKLTSINLASNPVVSKVSYFRKKMIVACKSLRYLDRPVSEMERATSEAWSTGGAEAEQEMKQNWQKMTKDKEHLGIQEFREWQSTVRLNDVVKPRYEIGGMDAESIQAAELDVEEEDVVAFCEELKKSYLAEDYDDGPQPVDCSPLLNFGSKKEIRADAIENIDETPRTKSISIVEIDEAAPKKVSFIDVPDEDEPTTITVHRVLDSNTNTLQDDDDGEEDVEEAVARLKGKRIRDSISIMKKLQHNQMSNADVSGWTKIMDETLLKQATGCQYDFDLVALSMANAFESDTIQFGVDSCQRRWSLLDLNVDPADTNKGNESTMPDDFICPITDKPLSRFANSDGQRKTLEELRRDSSRDCLLPPEKLPDPYLDDECGDEDLEATWAPSRNDLWANMQQQTSSSETAETKSDTKMSTFDDLD